MARNVPYARCTVRWRFGRKQTAAKDTRQGHYGYSSVTPAFSIARVISICQREEECFRVAAADACDDVLETICTLAADLQAEVAQLAEELLVRTSAIEGCRTRDPSGPAGMAPLIGRAGARALKHSRPAAIRGVRLGTKQAGPRPLAVRREPPLINISSESRARSSSISSGTSPSGTSRRILPALAASARRHPWLVVIGAGLVGYFAAPRRRPYSNSSGTDATSAATSVPAPSPPAERPVMAVGRQIGSVIVQLLIQTVAERAVTYLRDALASQAGEAQLDPAKEQSLGR